MIDYQSKKKRSNYYRKQVNEQTSFTEFSRNKSQSSSIKNQPWVSSIKLDHGEGQTDWQITVLDEKTAEASLLRIVISNDGLIVTEFGRKKFELEEIFMNLLSEQSLG